MAGHGRTWQDMKHIELIWVCLKKMGDAGIAQVLACFNQTAKKKLQVGSIKLGKMTFN
jgi:hypothetical protein